MKKMNIKTDTYELRDIICVAGSDVFDSDSKEIKKLQESLSDSEFMRIVAEISCKVLDHLTGEKLLNEDALMVVRYITRTYENQLSENFIE